MLTSIHPVGARASGDFHLIGRQTLHNISFYFMYLSRERVHAHTDVRHRYGVVMGDAIVPLAALFRDRTILRERGA
jgi:hypothetical protein